MNSNNCDRPGGGETIFLRRRRFVQTHRRTMFVCLNHIKRVKCCCCRELLHPVWYMANIHTGNNGKATSRYQDFVFRRTGTFCWILKLLEKQTSSSSNKAMCDLLNIARVQPNKKTSQNLSRQAPRTVFLPLPNKCLEHKRTILYKTYNKNTHQPQICKYVFSKRDNYASGAGVFWSLTPRAFSQIDAEMKF